MSRRARPAPPIDRRRRRLLQALAALGAAPVFGRALAALAAGEGRVTPEMIERAEWISGIELDDARRELMREGVDELLASFATLRAIELDNAVPPALGFAAEPGAVAAGDRGPGITAPARDEALAAGAGAEDDPAFASIGALAAALRAGAWSSVELTRRLLARRERYDPVLRAVITPTDALALEQAERADRELAAGRDRGPLAGIPWGAKDLFAVPGYRTTWGARPYRDQVREERATVVERLDAAGAVLVAKTAVGALAWGDVWFDAMTRNPWNPDQGASGSSAGSAAGVAAGLFPFALGTETWGSIVSPCTRCGVTGLRPTFGRVSRHGAMALAWSMDKVGPIARSVEDCALVFAAIHGADGRDGAALDRPFKWPAADRLGDLAIGYVPAWFEEDRAAEIEDEERAAALAAWRENDRASLAALERLGLELVPIEVPDGDPVPALSLILTAEAATAFDELTRSGRDAELTRQVARAWPNVFRQGQLIPAVEYLRANRVRTLVQRRMAEVMAAVDVYVTPTYGGNNLLLTNLTGHPQVVVPNGSTPGGTPTSLTFTGRLWGEAELMAVAAAYQAATAFHLRRPPMEKLLDWTPPPSDGEAAGEGAA